MLTPGYAPLEQYGRALKYGAFTDIYALGSTLYHLLTGEAPVSAIERAAGVELKTVQEIMPQISTHVSKAIAKAMVMDVTERTQSVREFLDQLHLDNSMLPSTVKSTSLSRSRSDAWSVFGQAQSQTHPRSTSSPKKNQWF